MTGDAPAEEVRNLLKKTLACVPTAAGVVVHIGD
jgi:hypothetical protein